MGISKVLFLVFCLFQLHSCQFFSSKEESSSNTDTSVQPIEASYLQFDENLAYNYIDKQVSFGPRVPSTVGHKACAEWILTTLKEMTDTAYIQEFESITYDSKKHKGKNIIAKLNSKNPTRILLCAHWDTRPIADHDPKNPTGPILGANDAGSGVGVILALLQNFKEKPITLGIDIVFFDLEDYGQPENSGLTPMENSWCLGSQYWAKNTKHEFLPRWGILLDMVGGKDATFLKEETSMNYASNLVNRVWSHGQKLGFEKHFRGESSSVIDDHVYINKLAGIPTIDIIHYKLNNGGFADYWHTHDDNMSSVDKSTLKAVGKTLLNTIYEEDKYMQ
ncbi:MAG: M28 family peptidase [Chitinophagales bacterium]|jgi:glutaminyl-peptide cyclotransferase|nr:M28 family peptidase [Sphingobacteriales bacterium]